MHSLRWRRHRKLVVMTVFGLLVMIGGFGTNRVTAITSSERGESGAYVSANFQGTVDLFDDSLVHEVEVRFDQDDYDRMIETYQDEGTKEYIEASVTIDGITIDHVGLRLKGNSTLGGLRSNGLGGGPQTQIEGVQSDQQSQSPGRAEQSGLGGRTATAQGTPVAGASFDDAFGDDADQPLAIGGDFGQGGLGGSVSADDPSSLPWLLKFDEYVKGQLYQGHAEIAIRPKGSSEAGLNESLALNLIAAAGEPSERSAYSSFSLNDGEPSLRLLVELPMEEYALDNFDSTGVLYKSLSTGSFSYRGEDPLAYADSFTQITRTNQQDLQPLIDLLKFVAESSDEEFAAEIANYVDVESLANYIALQDLLNNFDDMSGPGVNYYLWYDLEAERFTVLTWDMNLAFGQSGGFGVETRGNGGQFGGDQAPGGAGAQGRGDFQTAPDGAQPPANARDGNVVVGGFGGGGNALKERFLAAAAFDDLYNQANATMYDALYGNGQATAELQRLSAIVAASGLVDAATVESETASLQSSIDAKSAAGPKAAS